jgi:antitoxin YefM
MTVKEAMRHLDRLIEQVNVDADPTIICGDQAQKAVLLSLEEFNS